MLGRLRRFAKRWMNDALDVWLWVMVLGVWKIMNISAAKLGACCSGMSKMNG